ncbi:MAG: hypothetical protein PVG39_04450 [Desulfobacteraceae bacterium]|jgi:hypothetical protein
MEKIRENAAIWMLRRGWKKFTAKHREFEQSLFEHTMVELDALLSLLPILRQSNHFHLTKEEEKILIASVIAHDAGKEKPEWQEYVLGKRGFISDVNPDFTRQIIPELTNFLGFVNVDVKIISVIENCVNLHMRHERGDANVVSSLLKGQDRWKTLADLVDTIDNFCSAQGIFAALSSIERSILANHLKFSYHQITIRGVSTTMLHKACMDSFTQEGWQPLLHYSDSTLYASSASEKLSEPSLEKIEDQLVEIIKESIKQDISALMVGNPTASILPKPDLFDYQEIRNYLQGASKKVNRKSFIKKKETERIKVVTQYLSLKGERPDQSDDKVLSLHSQRIDSAHPQMVVFKFFKRAMDKNLIGVNGVKIVKEEYEKVFGEGSWTDLQNTSTLMAAKDMAQTVDYFWNLPGSQFGYKVDKIEELADEKKDELLIDILNEIARKVFSQIDHPPSRKELTQKMAKAFMQDLIKPSPGIEVKEIIAQQLEAYKSSKPFAGKVTKKAEYFCPVCNTPFKEGVKGSADFLDNPQSHTNRAVSHGSFGYVMICETCKYESFLRQIILGGKPAELIVLFPRMNIGYGSGNILVQKTKELYETAFNLMAGNSDDPGHKITFALTQIIARNALDRDLYQITPSELTEILSYRAGEDNRKKLRRTLEKEIKGVIGDTVDDLNTEWSTDFTTWDEAVDALIANRINDSVARSIRSEAYKLIPQMKLVCQTPNMILFPLFNPIKKDASPFQIAKESETNVALRKLFVSLLIGLCLDMTVAIVKDSDEIDFQGGEGVAFVPPVPSVRELVGSDWLSISDAEKWFRAIGAASIVAGWAAYPERSNLYSVLSAPTPGHILRRIEEKSESGQASYHQINYIEMVKEVLR